MVIRIVRVTHLKIVLLDETQTIAKITDFGISKESSGTANMTEIGTPDYMAPEILLTRRANEKVDVYLAHVAFLMS
jgi:serine/threonine protein kinase